MKNITLCRARSSQDCPDVATKPSSHRTRKTQSYLQVLSIGTMLNRTRVVVASAVTGSTHWQNARRIGMTSPMRCFSTTKDPSRPKAEKDQDLTRLDTTRKVVRRKQKDASFNTKLERKRDWKQDLGAPKAFPVLQPSIYYYSTPSHDSRRVSTSKPTPRLVLPVMNASALLDPLKYCKKSSRLSFNRNGVNRSISGTDAARRLLRGKKDFILAARSLKSQPTLLEGHGVPPQLFQHCIDMADALLLQYSPAVVECTFHNYNNVQRQNKLPHVLRIRG